MLCKNCKKNDATIHLHATLNGEQQQIDLCQKCYRDLKSQEDQMNREKFAQDPYGFGQLNDFFKQLAQQSMKQQQSNTQTQHGANGGTSILSEYGENLTQLAREGKIDPVIGRDGEIKRVIEILNRRTKNNPVLIGEPGVGKTAVVEGLALSIVNGDVPSKLENKEVIRLDVVSLVQGTGVRGQFEERMKQLITELKSQKNIILFIDEIHEIVGAGSVNDGSMDAGNILKPALARGELQLVGATTFNEYRIIEKDAALERRLQPVKVDEPTVEETIHILKGIQEKY